MQPNVGNTIPLQQQQQQQQQPLLGGTSLPYSHSVQSSMPQTYSIVQTGPHHTSPRQVSPGHLQHRHLSPRMQSLVPPQMSGGYPHPSNMPPQHMHLQQQQQQQQSMQPHGPLGQMQGVPQPHMGNVPQHMGGPNQMTSLNQMTGPNHIAGPMGPGVPGLRPQLGGPDLPVYFGHDQVDSGKRT